MHDSRTKGFKSQELISKEELELYDGSTNKEISVKTGRSIYIVKRSLIHHGLYVGKVYFTKCLSCQKEFGDFVKGAKFCCNTCKHSGQSIWNRGLTKTDSEILRASSVRMRGNKLGHLIDYSKKAVKKLFLPTLGVEIDHDTRSNLEKEWLLLVDKEPGIKKIERCAFSVPFLDDQRKEKNYYPDFIVYWETGVKWLVEVKGLATDLDYRKFEQTNYWAKDNGYDYRIITTGMVKQNSWSRVYSHYKNIKIESHEWMGMNHACAWSRSSASNRLQVGCVIFSMDFEEIFSYGYNGDERGGCNIPTSSAPGCDKFLHAEENALLKLKTRDACKMFITDSPCEMCAKRIINSGNIKEVYYLRPYRDMTGVGLLARAGIKVYNFVLVDHLGKPFSADHAYEHLRPASHDKFPS
jgi:dCMP deaminase